MCDESQFLRDPGPSGRAVSPGQAQAFCWRGACPDQLLHIPTGTESEEQAVAEVAVCVCF